MNELQQRRAKNIKRNTINRNTNNISTRKRKQVIQNISQSLSHSLERRKVFHGKMYGNDRDIYKILGYEKNLDYDDYYGFWRRAGLAKAIVQKAPDATWKDFPKIYHEKDNSDGDNNTFKSQIRKLDKKVKLFYNLHKVDKLSRIGEYGALFIGAKESGNIDLSAELNPVKGLNGISYIRPLTQPKIKPKTRVKDKNSPRYTLPELYNVKLPNENKTLPVHWSRIIWIAENTEENLELGTPALESVFNRLYDLQKVVGGSAEAFWSLADAGYRAIAEKEADVDWPKVLENFEAFSHDLIKLFAGQGLKDFDKMESKPPDPSNIWAMMIQYIAASADPPIPFRILIGSERGELASTTDLETWYGNITSRRNKHVNSNIIRPVIDRFINYDILPKTTYQIEWKPLFEMSKKDKMDLALTAAKAMKKFNEARSLGGEIITEEEFRTEYMGMEPKENNNITENKIPRNIEPGKFKDILLDKINNK